NEELLPQVEPLFGANGAVVPNSSYLDLVLSLVKERMTYVADFWEQASFFFIAPKELDLDAIRGKWSPEKTQFFQELVTDLANFPDWKADTLAAFFKEKVANSGMKMGELMMPLRIMLVNGKFGPDVFQIVELLGKNEFNARIAYALGLLQ